MGWPTRLKECRDPADYMHLACATWSLGYSQPNRTHVWDGGETDCSALVSWCLRMGMGLSTGELPWFSTYSEREALARLGFRELAPMADPMRNDVLWRSGHTALCLGGGRIGQASRDENHRDGWEGSRPGDQDGGETNVAPYRAESWELILRNEDMAALGASIENGETEGDDMALIICPSHTTTQYYFDGTALHAIGRQSERDALLKAYKAAGRDLPTVHWKKDEFTALQTMLKRGA